jgi:hypothetical protein
MKVGKLVLSLSVALLFAVAGVASADHGPGNLSGKQVLTGIPIVMSPQQQPANFSMQVREDAKHSRGVAVLKQVGKDVHYTFSWTNLTSPVTSAHFHKAPHATHAHVGVRAFSVCGVPGESTACPTGTTASVSGVWPDADVAAIENGEITVAFHTEVYPAPMGELGVYLGAALPVHAQVK